MVELTSLIRFQRQLLSSLLCRLPLSSCSCSYA